MSKCSIIAPLVTPYVDGDLPADDRRLVDEHVDACAPCRGRVRAERAVRDVLAAQRAAIGHDQAPRELRARCLNLARSETFTARAGPGGPGDAGRAWKEGRERLGPLALAAV